MGSGFEDRLKGLPWILGVIIITSCVHEAGHAWVAWRSGDRRHYIRQRMNPFTYRHISLPFTIILPAVMLLLTGFMFGGAKPVMVRMDVGRWRMALVALAGPVGNVLVGILTLSLIAGLVHANVIQRIDELWQGPYFYLVQGAMISFVLAIINLVPIPPADGSRVVAAFMPERMRRVYLSITLPGVILLFVLFVFGYQLFPTQFEAFFRSIYDFVKRGEQLIYGFIS